MAARRADCGHHRPSRLHLAARKRGEAAHAPCRRQAERRAGGRGCASGSAPGHCLRPGRARRLRARGVEAAAPPSVSGARRLWPPLLGGAGPRGRRPPLGVWCRQPSGRGAGGRPRLPAVRCGVPGGCPQLVPCEPGAVRCAR